MTEETQKNSVDINWDDATKNANFVGLETDNEKIITVTNWKFERRAQDAKIAGGEIEFISDCIEEDGKKIENKLFTTTSKRLKAKLRPFFEEEDKDGEMIPRPSDIVVKLSILKVGDKFSTNYFVQEKK
jgi:hypothetical protein